MHHAQDARAAVAEPSRYEIPQCSRRLTAAVLDWRTRLENGEDCAVLQVEILRFAQGDRDVLRELIEIAQLYEQRDSAPVLRLAEAFRPPYDACLRPARSRGARRRER